MSQRGFAVPPFAQECLDGAAAAWGASFDHPFVRELAGGTLRPELFRFYQMQDARYLEAFADAAAIIATRSPAPADKLWFIDAARMALVVESSLHAGYGETLGYGPEDVRRLELTPSNRAYQDHMVSTALRGTLVEAIAALAPCPWLYVELGQRLQRDYGPPPASHPYAAWLEMYADPGFDDYMRELLTQLQRAADAADDDARDRARTAFLTSVRYEWMFWQQAWEQQQWPAASTADGSETPGNEELSSVGR